MDISLNVSRLVKFCVGQEAKSPATTSVEIRQQLINLNKKNLNSFYILAEVITKMINIKPLESELQQESSYFCQIKVLAFFCTRV